MACPSYTVVIIPLRTSLYSLDALRFYLWVKRLKDLEMEKDSLWCGVDVLEQARLWYRRRLEENRSQQAALETQPGFNAGGSEGALLQARCCQLRCRIQRVNGSLGSMMSEPQVTSGSTHSLPDAVADSDLRWHNSVLAQEVSEKNRQIAILEIERERLLQQLGELYAQ